MATKVDLGQACKSLASSQRGTCSAVPRLQLQSVVHPSVVEFNFTLLICYGSATTGIKNQPGWNSKNLDLP